VRYTEAQIKEWICRRLGRGVIKVELTDDQVDAAIEDAKVWWQSWVGQCKSVLFTLTTDTEYTEDLIATDIDSVVDVVFELSSQSLIDLFSWADVEVNPYTWVYGGSGDMLYSTLVQYMQYRELAKQIVSSEKTWDWDRAKRSLIISPKPEAGSRILVTYISTTMTMAYMTNYEMRIFRNYALSQAMKTLAMIRMKYAEKPSASGGGFAMDGDAVWANAEAIENETEEKARQLQEPVAFFAE
jgi:hypothetical protein